MSRAVRYHVIDKIAHGGMAEIFLARQLGAEGFQKPVVLKRILPALAADPSFVRMLVDEAHIASTLNHSNVVQVLDLGKAGEQFFLVLEFVDGWSLEQVRRRARKARMKFPLPLALHIVSALCRALAYAHTRKRDGVPLGIVHRDVTPQNVLLSREGEVKLADFGIAKAVGKREKSTTGVIKGKFAYMSPEQSMGGDLDARSDLFSVGSVLYLLTTGHKPFEGTTDLDILMRVRRGRYEKPSALVKDFNPEVERFIARALRTDRTRRWQSGEQMADRIDAILVKLGQPSGPPALKRWLETLGARDGVRAPADGAPSTAPPEGAGDQTIQLGSHELELELEDVALPVVGSDHGAPLPRPFEAPRPPSLPASTPPDGVTPVAATATTASLGDETTTTLPVVVSQAYDAIQVSAATPVPLDASQMPDTPQMPESPETTPRSDRRGLPTEEPAASVVLEALPSAQPPAEPAAAPPRMDPPRRDPARRARRLALATLALTAAAVLGGAVYLVAARPTLAPPGWLMEPVHRLLRRLPAPRAGHGTDHGSDDGTDDGTNWTGDPRTPEPRRP